MWLHSISRQRIRRKGYDLNILKIAEDFFPFPFHYSNYRLSIKSRNLKWMPSRVKYIVKPWMVQFGLCDQMEMSYIYYRAQHSTVNHLIFKVKSFSPQWKEKIETRFQDLCNIIIIILLYIIISVILVIIFYTSKGDIFLGLGVQNRGLEIWRHMYNFLGNLWGNLTVWKLFELITTSVSQLA